MIENVVFDLGRVFFPFDLKLLISHFNDGVYSEHIYSVLSKYWDIRDTGVISDKKFIEIVKSKLDDSETEVIKRLVNGWIDTLTFDSEVVEEMNILKKKGIKVYVLSNIPKDFIKRFRRFKEFKCVDGVMFSANEKILKPKKEIFLRAIKKFNIDPEKSLYIDDKTENVESSVACGFNGEVYKNNIKEILDKYMRR